MPGQGGLVEAEEGEDSGEGGGGGGGEAVEGCFGARLGTVGVRLDSVGGRLGGFGALGPRTPAGRGTTAPRSGDPVGRPAPGRRGRR
ncbi:hypothetical protein AABC07_12460, partial [Streptomyces sp. LNU-CPARS28]|uniref:hypothetical protein n=1 Tax=Streptomyces sp. LNU-CPARS28 TaxID=3137371 RepID=UPI003135E741